MATELCVTIGRGANRLHRASCPRPRVRYPLAMVAASTVMAAFPAKCCKPSRAAVRLANVEAVERLFDIPAGTLTVQRADPCMVAS